MWHPHVYGHPPERPTPFSIDDILQNRSAESQTRNLDQAFQIQTNNLMSFFGVNPIQMPLARVI